MNLKLLKIYLSLKISEDIKFINSVILLYIKILNIHSQKLSKRLRSALNIEQIQNSIEIMKNPAHKNFKLFIKYYTQQYLIIFIGCNLKDKTKIENLRTKNNILGLSIDHPKLIVDDFLDNFKEEIQKFLDSFNIPANNPNPKTNNLKSAFRNTTSPLIMIAGSKVQKGGNKTYYKSLSNVLEVIAEPIHDFGGSRSYANTFFTSNYNGSMSGEEIDSNDLPEIYREIVDTEKKVKENGLAFEVFVLSPILSGKHFNNRREIVIGTRTTGGEIHV